MDREGNISLLIDECNGIDIPKIFVEGFELSKWGLREDDEDVICVRKGPENNEEYWDSWQEILRKAVYIEPKSKVQFSLHENGGLFAVAWDEIEDGDEILI